MDLNDLLEKVNSRQSFLNFVAALRDDKIDEEQKEKIKKSSPYGPGANGWENGTIEMFLDAVHSFGQDSSHVTEHPDWKTFCIAFIRWKILRIKSSEEWPADNNLHKSWRGLV
jgi:hypothetical protein